MFAFLRRHENPTKWFIRSLSRTTKSNESNRIILIRLVWQHRPRGPTFISAPIRGVFRRVSHRVWAKNLFAGWQVRVSVSPSPSLARFRSPFEKRRDPFAASAARPWAVGPSLWWTWASRSAVVTQLSVVCSSLSLSLSLSLYLILSLVSTTRGYSSSHVTRKYRHARLTAGRA